MTPGVCLYECQAQTRHTQCVKVLLSNTVIALRKTLFEMWI